MPCIICRRWGHNSRTCPIRGERTPTTNSVLARSTVALQNRRITNLVPTNRWSRFKIGITGNPENRATSQEYREYSELILLYRTTSQARVRQWERHAAPIVRRFHARCANEEGSLGAGNLGNARWYYLYIVRRRRWFNPLEPLWNGGCRMGTHCFKMSARAPLSIISE